MRVAAADPGVPGPGRGRQPVAARLPPRRGRPPTCARSTRRTDGCARRPRATSSRSCGTPASGRPPSRPPWPRPGERSLPSAGRPRRAGAAPTRARHDRPRCAGRRRPRRPPRPAGRRPASRPLTCPTDQEIPCPKPSSSPPPARPSAAPSRARSVDAARRPRRPDASRRRWPRCPQLDPPRHRRPDAGLRPARRRGRASTWPAWSPSSPGWTTCPAPRSTATARRACRPSAWRPTPSRPARATSSSPPASRRSAASARAAPTATPTPRTPCSPRRRRADRAAVRGASRPGADPRERRRCPTSTSPWARPPRTWPQLEGVSREEQDEFAVRQPEPGREGRGRRVLRARDHAGHAARRHRRLPGRRPAGRRRRWRRWPQLEAGVPARRHGHRRQRLPAERRRRRGRRDERHARPSELGLTPLARIVAHRRVRRCPPRSWASARSRPAAGAGPGRPDHRRHRPGRDQRGVRRPGRSRRPGTSASTWDKLNVHGGAIAARPPLRHDRRPHHDHADQRPAGARTSRSASRRCASAAARAWP